jgi:hypothetical protein
MKNNLTDVYNENKHKLEHPNWTLDKYGNYKPKNSNLWIHDWEAHILGSLKDIWNDLSPETKAALFITAKEMADNEEWD